MRVAHLQHRSSMNCYISYWAYSSIWLWILYLFIHGTIALGYERCSIVRLLYNRAWILTCYSVLYRFYRKIVYLFKTKIVIVVNTIYS